VKLPFSESVAWITGATSGIGRACALELVRQGATVAVSGRRRDRLDELVREIEAGGGQALAVPCDVCDEASLAHAVEQVARQLGQLDIALANAGYAVGGKIEELGAAAWRKQLDTNVVGAALTARHALPQLRRTSGRLAFTGSVSAFIPAPGFAAYHCSKYALRALAHTLQAELEGTGVSCTIVHPGFVESEINQVDNDGVRNPDRTDRRPRQLMWTADRAARVIVEAIRKRRREVVFTGHGRIAATLGMHFPSLAHLVMTRGPMRARAETFRTDRERS
jgi:NAD(P)-dependent dehydrogenase (short-subunit alcohol dehydrogenase family)